MLYAHREGGVVLGSLIKQTVGKKSYYYAIETKRVNGVPRVVSKQYLGRLEDIVKKVTETPRPSSVMPREFGLQAALLKITDRLGFVELVDKIVIKRQQGPSVGQYMLVAALNRCSAPTSKSRIGEWYGETILERVLKIEPGQFTSQSFWDNMDLIGEDEVVELQVALAKKVVELYQIDLRVLLYDATNFFTYIDTNNTCKLPRRGHNKQKRNDLRQIGLAMMVSRDGGTPLFFDVYQGNVSDPVEFDHFIRDLVKRFNDIFTACDDLTIVCDKGNNSKTNLELVASTPFHFVASLAPSHLKQVLGIPLAEYRDCKSKRLEGEKYYITRENVFGIERTVVVVYNPALLQGQLQGIMNNLHKTQKALGLLKEKLAAWKGAKRRGKRPTAASVERLVNRILSREYMKTLISYTVQEVDNEWVDLQYSVNEQAFDELKATLLGKTVLFSDRDDWEAEEYILTYRDQYGIEHDFRQMKDPSWVSWDPLLHWTDQKIRVHAFYCFTALLISSLLKRELKDRRISMSLPRAFEKLSKIMEVTITYPSSRGKEPARVVMLSEMDREQKMLYDALDLGVYTV
jgi:transposase